jgi:hypothetical protein
MRYLVVNVDDFGYGRSVSQGIIEAYERGIVTKAAVSRLGLHGVVSSRTRSCRVSMR